MVRGTSPLVPGRAQKCPQPGAHLNSVLAQKDLRESHGRV